MKMPACWDTLGNWAEWNKLNQLAGSAPGKALDHYCADCTPGYQALMVQQNKCAYPTVTFMSIIERRRDPATGKIHCVASGCIKGKRCAADEEAWQLRYEIRKNET